MNFAPESTTRPSFTVFDDVYHFGIWWHSDSHPSPTYRPSQRLSPASWLQFFGLYGAGFGLFNCKNTINTAEYLRRVSSHLQLPLYLDTHAAVAAKTSNGFATLA